MTGTSRHPDDAGLVYKVLGKETKPVKAKVREFWQLVRHQALGARVPKTTLLGMTIRPPARVRLRRSGG